MKVYVRAMPVDGDKALMQARSYSQSILKHIIKILVYNEIRER